MKTSLKISVLGAIMFLSTSAYSQSDSLGLPGDDLDLNAVLSIFKKSSSVEDFEKRLNSADTKVNNLDLNNDNQVDYLRVVDYGKDDFHSIVIQDPVSKAESQDVAVIEVVKKDDNTAHVQIVGDESLYGKDYIIEPRDQAPLKKSSNNSTNDDVYESANSSDNSNTQVMVNVWAWPTVTYIYTPGYSYYVSPWYWGYYPGWYSPWSPYGWHAYHYGWVGYNYGFYGYRRHHYAFPHAHNYYYGRRVSSGYVQKTAPNYGRRRDAGYNRGGHNRAGDGRVQQRNNGPRDQNVHRNNSGRTNQANPGRNRSQNDRVQSNSQNRNNVRSNERQNNVRSSDRSSNPRSSSPSGGHVDRRNATPNSGTMNQGNSGRRQQVQPQAKPQNNGGQRVNTAPRSSPGGGSPAGGGGSPRGGGGGGGGGRSGGGGGGARR